jgi:stearoyl-CoA desaturase (delta-9 desaturase)
MVKGSFIDDLLYAPSYGWKDKDNALVIPTKRQLWSEAFSRVNIFKTRKNWISFVSFLMLAGMLPFFVLFFWKYFSWYLVIAIVVYSMMIMGTHGTISGSRLT